ncbi:hypothetical protein [Phyllobacterium bourgognense]|uniref:Uncharacterized protein n=1 Tax=Phyllobacterium bourgognense TaxID=314236 RepID=A0A368YYA4_9HYPH|nr:hypothetical protein [Phyllobacterium bourgognense]RCW85171.1 hypothetical protein C7476_10311 [Phyllobacterium bourgognense]
MALWLDILREKNDLAGQLSEKIPRFLAYERLTLDQATRLHIFLENHAEEMRNLAREIGAVDLVEALHEAADALDSIFSDLAAAAELKVAELRQKEAYVNAPPAPKLAYS